MKKILTVLVFSLTVLISTFAVAGPSFDRGGVGGRGGVGVGGRGGAGGFPPANFDRSYNRDNGGEQILLEQRRMREERGVQRLKQHLWQTGFVMPQHYRGNGYKIDYQNYNLPKPDYNQQWYKVNNDFILVNSDTNDIIKVLSF